MADSVLDSHALPILLRHESILQHDVLCKLLCASKALQAMVADTCTGQMLGVQHTMPSHQRWETEAKHHTQQRLKQFVAWLAHYAPLLQSLQLNLLPPLQRVPQGSSAPCTVPDHKAKAESAVAAALQQAAAGAAGPLQLQSFKFFSARTTALCILQALPTNSLTSLHLEISRSNAHLGPFERLKGPKPPSVSTVAPVLASLTALRSLTLVSPEARLLVPALMNLTNLQDLSITYLDVQCVGQLQQLSAGLQSLHFNVLEQYEYYYDDKEEEEEAAGNAADGGAGNGGSNSSSEDDGEGGAAAAGSNAAAAAAEEVSAPGPQQQKQCNQQQQRPCLQLRHLAALTRLTSHTYRLQPDDVLPPSLRILELGSCCCVQPLLRCQQLTRLHLHKEPPPAPEDLLLIRKHLKGLRSVGLAYQRLDAAAATAAAAAWLALPLVSLELELDMGQMSRGMLQQLGQQQHLTRLCVTGDSSVIAASPAEVGGVLLQLSQLQELELHSIKVQQPGEEEVAAAAAEAGRGARRAAAQGTGSGQQAAAAGGQQAGAALQAVASTAAQQATGSAGAAAAAAAGVAAALDSTVSEMGVLVQAIAALPQLHSLTLSHITSSSGIGLGSQDLTPLAAATQLTCLHLFMCNANDAAVASIARSLTGLRRLGLDHCPRVTDAAAAVAVREMKQLSWLSVWGTQVRDRTGLQQQLPNLELVGWFESITKLL